MRTLLIKIALLSALTLSMAVSCPPKKTVEDIQINKVCENVEMIHPPLPDEFTWEKFKWTVLTPEIIREMLGKYDTNEISDSDLVFFALTPSGYEHLSINMAEIKRLIADQKSVIMYYRDNSPASASNGK